jgi:undecaprenyl-diphosphatase
MSTALLLTVVFLGFIEGLTEFLPVSSTGHLILLGALLGFQGEAETTFKIAIQLGAILAVVVAYWGKLWGVATTLHRSRESQAFTRNILLAVIPAMVIGVIAYDGIKMMLEKPVIVAWALLIGGVVILVLERMQKVVRIPTIEAMPWTTALIIGVAQCIAMIPGVSRSGATIMGALLLGVERKTAAEFTFFLAIPTMVAATAYSLYKSWAVLDFTHLTAIGLGFTVAFVTALAVVKAFVAIVGRYGFAPFAWYRIVVGGGALIWLALK